MKKFSLLALKMTGRVRSDRLLPKLPLAAGALLAKCGRK